MTFSMDAFDSELVRRLPLARAMMEACHFAFQEQALEQLYQDNRGRCYTDTLKFPQMVDLVRDALLEHQGSGHRMYQQLEREGNAPADESSFYRKLGNMPVEVSRALLRSNTARLTQLITPQVDLLPGWVEMFDLVVLDGKKIKNVAKRPILFLADRQFGDYKTHQLMRQRPCDHVLLRIREKLAFEPQEGQTRQGIDDQGRRFVDQIGVFGTGKNAQRMRRITLYRTDAQGKADNVVLITDLMDQKAFPPEDLLKLYRRRWGIEQMFQQVTQTFSLQSLISCSPKGVLFQLSLCLLMYNLVQVIKAYVAAEGNVAPTTVSTSNLFYDVRRELTVCSYLAPTALLAAAGNPPDQPQEMCRRLRQLLEGCWDPIAYTKAADKKPRQRAAQKKSLHGGHTSVQRLLNGNAKKHAVK